MKKSAQNHKNNKPTQIKKAAKWWVLPAITAFLVIAAGVVTLTLKRPPADVNQPSAASDPVKIVNSTDISLPKPDLRSSNSIEAVMNTRRSRREFIDQNITLKQVSQMLWAAQGLTTDWGGRTTPSAKSTYPLTIYLVSNKVDGLDPGEYQYIPGERTPVHTLKPIKKVDLQKAMYEQLNQSSFQYAPAVLVITGNMSKMADAFGGVPNDNSVYLEAGHAGQNLYLQAESLKLGMVTVATFNEARMRELVTIPASETIIYLIPFGIPKL